jgi:hypothetical protein
MVCGVPVVVSNAGGLPELVADGEGGFVFPIGDTKAMADCIVGLLSDPVELARQKELLARANEVERLRGAASRPYIQPSRGDLKHEAAKALLSLARSGEKGVAVMNAKKETAYMFADELIALHDACPDAPVTYIANLEERGLPKVRLDAARIAGGLRDRGIPLELLGALDEYGALGDRIGKRIVELAPAYAFIVGVPHAIPPRYLAGIDCISVTNGPRQVAPLRELGHRYVVVEVDPAGYVSTGDKDGAATPTRVLVVGVKESPDIAAAAMTAAAFLRAAGVPPPACAGAAQKSVRPVLPDCRAA